MIYPQVAVPIPPRYRFSLSAPPPIMGQLADFHSYLRMYVYYGLAECICSYNRNNYISTHAKIRLRVAFSRERGGRGDRYAHLALALVR